MNLLVAKRAVGPAVIPTRVAAAAAAMDAKVAAEVAAAVRALTEALHLPSMARHPERHQREDHPSRN